MRPVKLGALPVALAAASACIAACDGGEANENSSNTASRDVAPPTVAILSPADGAVVSGVVEINVFAEDPGGIRTTELYLDGSSMSGKCTWLDRCEVDVSGMPLGSWHSLVAVAWDKSGNPGASQSVAFVIGQAQQPAVAITWPPAGSTVEGDVLVRALVLTSVGAAEATLFVDGFEVESKYPPWKDDWDPERFPREWTCEWTWTTTDMIPGSYHSLLVLATDRARNTVFSDPLPVRLTIGQGTDR